FLCGCWAAASAGNTVEDGLSLGIRGVHISAVVGEELDDVVPTPGHGAAESGLTAGSALIDVCASFQERVKGGNGALLNVGGVEIAASVSVAGSLSGGGLNGPVAAGVRNV